MAAEDVALITNHVNILKDDYDLLTSVLDILSTAEKSTENKEELSKKVTAFKAKLVSCKEKLLDIKGLDCSPEQQIQTYEKYLKDLKSKREALEKFRYLDVITKNQIKNEEE